MPALFSTVSHDLRYSIRTLRKSPGFALTAVLTLAVGIGSVAAVFSVVHSVLLQPFAFPQPDRLVVLRETSALIKGGPGPDNYQQADNWREHAKTFSSVAIFSGQDVSIATGADHPQIVPSLQVSPGFMHTLGVAPILGRSFVIADAITNGAPVAILSWSAWQQFFHGDPAVIGRTLRSSGVPQTVVGVLPRDFRFPHMSGLVGTLPAKDVVPYAVFTPLPSDDSIDGNYNYLAIGRLRDGVSMAQATAELKSLQANYTHAHHLVEQLGAWLNPFHQDVTGAYSTALWVLFAAVGAVLMIGCANLANLQLARAVGRERELAVRAALGAGRTRMLWTMFAESLVLAVAGGALGILLAFAAVPALVAAAPTSVPRLDQAHMSWPVLLLAVGLSVLTTLLAGTLPALRALRVDPQSAMQTTAARMSGTREGRKARNLLVGGEVACTVMLLLVTGLLLHSLLHLLTQSRDFDAGHVTIAQADLYTPQYSSGDEDASARVAFIDRSLAGLRQIPGVQAAAMTSELPMAGATWINPIVRPDQPIPPALAPHANIRWISPGYLKTLQIPLVEGRALEASDKDHPTNALISRQTARAIWPGLDPIGRTFTMGVGATFTVVGVVADARINDLHSIASMVYFPYWESPKWRTYFLVRSTQGTASLAPSIRRVLWGIDPQVPIPVLKSMDAQIDDSVATERFGAILLTAFGCAALLLAFLGIYGVTAYTVSLRVPEFGLRMALGSSRAALIRLVVRQATVPVLGGVCAGLALSFLAVRSIASLLYQTSAVSPGVIAAAVTLLAATAVIAAWLPGRRAAAANPMDALRTQ